MGYTIFYLENDRKCCIHLIISLNNSQILRQKTREEKNEMCVCHVLTLDFLPTVLTEWKGSRHIRHVAAISFTYRKHYHGNQFLYKGMFYKWWVTSRDTTDSRSISLDTHSKVDCKWFYLGLEWSLFSGKNYKLEIWQFQSNYRLPRSNQQALCIIE